MTVVFVPEAHRSTSLTQIKTAVASAMAMEPPAASPMKNVRITISAHLIFATQAFANSSAILLMMEIPARLMAAIRKLAGSINYPLIAMMQIPAQRITATRKAAAHMKLRRDAVF